MYNILLVEDSEDYQLLIAKTLGSLTKDLTVVPTFQGALEALKTGQFDVILLDVGLPDKDGFAVCHELQSSSKTSHIPVFFVTGKDDAASIVAALSMGAEDVILKPFEPMVLRARIESRLNKIKAAKGNEEIVELEDLRVNLHHMKAYLQVDGKPVDLQLTPTEFKLLYQLTKVPERVFSRDQLLTLVWGSRVNVFDRTVDVHLSSLRRKLGKYSRCIEAIQGLGYRFSLNVRPSKVA